MSKSDLVDVGPKVYKETVQKVNFYFRQREERALKKGVQNLWNPYWIIQNLPKMLFHQLTYKIIGAHQLRPQSRFRRAAFSKS